MFDLINSRPVKRKIEELSTSSAKETPNKRIKQQQQPANSSLDRFIQREQYSPGQSEAAVKEHELPCLSVDIDLNGIAQRIESLTQRLVLNLLSLFTVKKMLLFFMTSFYMIMLLSTATEVSGSGASGSETVLDLIRHTI